MQPDRELIDSLKEKIIAIWDKYNLCEGCPNLCCTGYTLCRPVPTEVGKVVLTGHFVEEEVELFTKKEWALYRAELVEKDDHSCPFLREGGCVIPRLMRSSKCLRWVCKEKESEISTEDMDKVDELFGKVQQELVRGRR